MTDIKKLVRKRWKSMSLVAVMVLAAGTWMMLGSRSTITIDTGTGPGWVKLESKDQEGRPVLPVDLVEGTAHLRWEDRKERGIDEVILMIGYHPSSVLGLWNKMYRVERIFYGDDDAWRRSVMVTIHLPLSRAYEAEWFKNMQDRILLIHPVANPMKPNQTLHIKSVHFGRKEIDIVVDGKRSEKQRMFAATIRAEEPIIPALYDTTFGTMTKSKINTVLGAFIGAVLAGLFLQWLSRHGRSDAY